MQGQRNGLGLRLGRSDRGVRRSVKGIGLGEADGGFGSRDYRTGRAGRFS